ncbi:hypothetical protein AB6A40_000020 [Gnathostoma spinigerum]|uniref:SOCS box domain-containing protein n=1 Tax=Gnathostoma spinigerum TaxID=75299 RepID=A0ABD6E2H8_9BILA
MSKTSYVYLGNHEYNLKFLLVGDSDVGKNEITDLLLPSTSELASKMHSECSARTTTILLEGRRVRLQMWDTCGQGRFSTIFRFYSKGAHGIILVYDITNRWSFDGIRRWITEVDENAPGIPRILVGNRLHLEFNRAVSRSEAMTFAKKANLQYFEVSTLAYFNVHECLTELARLAIVRNGMHWLWRSSKVLSLHDICCRTIVSSVQNVHSIERLPLPPSVKFEIRSYAHGADVCMACIKSNEPSRSLSMDLSRRLVHWTPPNLLSRRRSQRPSCSVM